MSRGSKSTTKAVRPGIMPVLFGRHLIDKAVFLGLGEVAAGLPPLQEECVPVAMDAELARAYTQDVEEPLAPCQPGEVLVCCSIPRRAPVPHGADLVLDL